MNPVPVQLQVKLSGGETNTQTPPLTQVCNWVRHMLVRLQVQEVKLAMKPASQGLVISPQAAQGGKKEGIVSNEQWNHKVP